MWNSLANLLKFMKLREDTKEYREIGQHLCTNIVNTARSKRNGQQATTHVDHLLFQLADEMYLNCDAKPFLDRAQELMEEAVDTHANYNTKSLTRVANSKKQWREEDVSVKVEFQAQVSGHQATKKVSRIPSYCRLAARRQIQKGQTYPILTRLLVEWAARAKV